MLSPLRVECNFLMQRYDEKLSLKGAKILDIGIGGDEKPSGNYKFFGKGNHWTTLDRVAIYQPDIVADICESGLVDNSFDLVICSNTIEHVWDFKKAISEVIRIAKKYFIIDCPWSYPFHPCDAEGDFADYWRISALALRRLVEEAGGEVIEANQTDIFTSILGSKRALCENIK